MLVTPSKPDMLVSESLGQHINKGYIYFAMAFSLLVEIINLRVRKIEGSKLGPIINKPPLPEPPRR